MRVSKLTLTLSALIMSTSIFASDLTQVEGSWYPKGTGNGYIRKVSIPRGGFDFSDPEAMIARGKASYIGSCLSCAQRETVIIGNIETGIAFSSIVKGRDTAEYIEMKALDWETLSLEYKVTRRPDSCRPPYHCVWLTVKSGKLTFSKGR